MAYFWTLKIMRNCKPNVSRRVYPQTIADEDKKWIFNCQSLHCLAENCKIDR